MDTTVKIINFVTFFFFFLTLFNCYGLYRAFGKYTYALIRKSVSITIKTEGMISLLAGIFGLFSAMLVFLFPDSFPKIPIPFLLSISILAIVRQLSPAFFLYLGKSEPDVIYLFGKIKRRIQPFKIIHMLEGGQFGAIASGELEFEGYRSRNQENWKTVVAEYMETIPVILIDTRHATESTMFELEHILHKNLQFKTIFISGEFGETPAIDLIEKKYNNFSIKKSLRIVSVIEISNILGQFTKNVLEGNAPHLPGYTEIFTSRGDHTKNYFHNKEYGVFFEIPPQWRFEDTIKPLTFFGPNGALGINNELFQLMIDPVLPRYKTPESRIELLREPGVNVYKGKFGSASNVVIAENVKHTEISIVHKNNHILISHSNDNATRDAIKMLSGTFRIG